MKPAVHTVVTGFCMGAADVVPGVSGGTVAFLFGIYRRLLTAIRHVDLTLLKHLAKGQIATAWKHVDASFLFLLGSGLAVGFILSALTVKKLLEHATTRGPTLACFAGLIAASAVLLCWTLEFSTLRQQVRIVSLGLIGLIAAAGVCLMSPNALSEPPALWFVFVCGAIGICAMILPGISGAMILMLIGVYEYLLSMPHELLHGKPVEALQVIIVFGLGCATGIISFSHVLTWLLDRYEQGTTALLVGLMTGSIVRLWPFQDMNEHETALRLPLNATEGVFAFALFTVGLVFVLAIQRIATARKKALEKEQQLQPQE